MTGFERSSAKQIFFLLFPLKLKTTINKKKVNKWINLLEIFWRFLEKMANTDIFFLLLCFLNLKKKAIVPTTAGMDLVLSAAFIQFPRPFFWHFPKKKPCWDVFTFGMLMSINLQTFSLMSMIIMSGGFACTVRCILIEKS